MGSPICGNLHIILYKQFLAPSSIGIDFGVNNDKTQKWLLVSDIHHHHIPMFVVINNHVPVFVLCFSFDYKSSLWISLHMYTQWSDWYTTKPFRKIVCIYTPQRDLWNHVWCIHPPQIIFMFHIIWNDWYDWYTIKPFRNTISMLNGYYIFWMD